MAILGASEGAKLTLTCGAGVNTIQPLRTGTTRFRSSLPRRRAGVPHTPARFVYSVVGPVAKVFSLTYHLASWSAWGPPCLKRRESNPRTGPGRRG